MDFTLDLLKTLFRTLLDSGYSFLAVKDHAGIINPDGGRHVILRHDVDRKPSNALACARMEAAMGITGTYYFRTIPGSFDSIIIREIALSGHDIGYHYEDLNLVSRKSKAAGFRSPAEGQKTGGEEERYLATMAYGNFRKNLAKLRAVAPIQSICMHGSPLSRYDSRLIWKYFDYGELGVETEPYFDISLDEMLYLTDTGRRWDGSAVSVRDRVYSRDEKYYEHWVRKPVAGSAMAMTTAGEKLHTDNKFRKSADILSCAKAGCLPDRMFLTLHPQRWSNSMSAWIAELVSQNIKNRVKYIIKNRHGESEKIEN